MSLISSAKSFVFFDQTEDLMDSTIVVADKALDFVEKHGVLFDELDIDVWRGWYSYAEPGVIRIGSNAWSVVEDDPDWAFDIILHELGHVWLWERWDEMAATDKRKWQRHFGPYEQLAIPGRRYFRYEEDEHITEYAAVCAQEDWAEVFYNAFYSQRYPSKPIKKKVDFTWSLIKKYA